MDLSAKMPATQPATMEAKMPSQIASDAPPYAGEGGSDDAPDVETSQQSTGGVEWQAINDNKPGWEIGNDEQKGPTWEMEDRKDENDEGAMPQRDPDDDGDLN